MLCFSFNNVLHLSPFYSNYRSGKCLTHVGREGRAELRLEQGVRVAFAQNSGLDVGNRQQGGYYEAGYLTIAGTQAQIGAEKSRPTFSPLPTQQET